ncbi:hypothetical protein [Parenemella sanctibonifatiensis]|uniref:Alpha/beta hydrolase n=1 Tax=Parenemella sanctibonifatiensis TaxID=2016505 RepID=A0A255ED82_9ACTN|nr:hypothetical protein [Parenemella sanctibonifatiensis]OYN88881.1 hypothetical protein CGZ92_04045 [Parenemella sanctibonifatiensis]
MITTILLLVVALVVLAAFLAPFEALRWWGRQASIEASSQLEQAAPKPPREPDEPTCWVVYVSGVGATSPVINRRGEQPLIDGVQARLQGAKIVSHIYPYDMTNVGLTDGRWSSRFWRLVSALGRSRFTSTAHALVYLRNVMQVMVSADSRYGPVYSLGIAKVIWEELLRNGYQPRTRAPIVLLGWSGGAQIALGAASYLAATGAKTSVLSLGGFLNSDPALDHIAHLWHLKGTKDWVQALARGFPSRWPQVQGSAWNRAKAAGRITQIVIGPMRHLGRGSYLSSGVMLPDGRSCRDTTMDAIADTIAQAGLAKRLLPPS